MADRNVTIVLPEDLIEALDLVARELGVSRSQVIRRLCVRYLPRVNEMIEESRPGVVINDLVYFISGAPVFKTGDSTDEEFARAFDAMRARVRASKKPQKKRAGRPRKKGGADA